MKGFKQFLILNMLNLYNDVMKLELSECEMFLGIISAPWSFKIIYGLLSDNVKIFGTKRKGHLLVNAGSCIFVMTLIIVFGMHLGKYFVTGCVFISQINIAYIDCVTDALTIQVSTNSVKHGTENLNTIAFLAQGIGAIVGAMMAIMFNCAKQVNPYESFGVYIMLMCVYFLFALNLDSRLEPPELLTLNDSLNNIT